MDRYLPYHFRSHVHLGPLPWAAAVAVLLLLTPVARGDEIELTDGTRIDGKILEETAEGFRIDVPGDGASATVKIAADKVHAVSVGGKRRVLRPKEDDEDDSDTPWDAPRRPAKPKDGVRLMVSSGGKTRVIAGLDVVQLLFDMRKYADAEKAAYRQLWDDMEQPAVLSLLARSLEQQNKDEEAAVYYTVLLRILEQSPPSVAAKYKNLATRKLAVLNQGFDEAKARYEANAAGKRFDSPEAVDDLWMTQVRGDIRCLHGLYAWTLVGGRKKGVPENWIHNRDGSVQRSGMKLMKDVDGRRGVLLTVPLKESHADVHGHRTGPGHVYTRNPGKCRFLRIGVKGYNFPFVLKVKAAGKVLFSETISSETWHDVKVDLGEKAASGDGVTLDLVVPEEQRWFEGVWLDYVDFFGN